MFQMLWLLVRHYLIHFVLQVFDYRPRSAAFLRHQIANSLLHHAEVGSKLCGRSVAGVCGFGPGSEIGANGVLLANIASPLGRKARARGSVVVGVEGVGCDENREPIAGTHAVGRVRVDYAFRWDADNDCWHVGLSPHQVRFISNEPLVPRRGLCRRRAGLSPVAKG